MKSVAHLIVKNLDTANENSLISARKAKAPVILLFGRVIKLEGICAELFYQTKRLTGESRQLAYKHSHDKVLDFQKTLNRLQNKFL